MRKIILISLFFAFAAYGQQTQRIAIMGTEDDGEPPIKILEQVHLTDKLREVAGDILPKNLYTIMTQQSIVDMLGSQEQAAKICREAICLADLGRKVNADYVAQARIGRFGKNLTIKIELYRVGNSSLIASFASNSKDVQGLLATLEAKAPALFKKMPGVSNDEPSSPPPPSPPPLPPPPPPPSPPVAEPASESVPEPPIVVEPAPNPFVEQAKMSVAQALVTSSLPRGCLADFKNLLESDGFSMGNFVKELPPAVAKVKLQLKSPFGKPKDDDKTNVGLTVGCIKALPESPAEIQSLLKDISLKAGLAIAVEVVESVAENSIPANITDESGSDGGAFWSRNKNIIRGALLGLAAVSTGIAIYQNGVAADKKDDMKKTFNDAETAYIAGDPSAYYVKKRQYDIEKADVRSMENTRNGFYISAGLFGIAGVMCFFF